MYILERFCLVAWLVGVHLLLRDSGPNGVFFLNVRCYNRSHDNVVRSVGPYGIIFVTVFCSYSNRKLTDCREQWLVLVNSLSVIWLRLRIYPHICDGVAFRGYFVTWLYFVTYAWANVLVIIQSVPQVHSHRRSRLFEKMQTSVMREILW
jgi:hypothetical protein